MKLWHRFFLGAVLATLMAAAVHAQVTPVGILSSPASAAPGDLVTFPITVSNAGGEIDNGTADFSIVLTNTVTGASFTISGLNVPTVGQITAATSGPPPTAGTGTFNVTGVIPTKTTQAGNYRATVTMSNFRDAGAPEVGGGSFSVSTTVLLITGKPDFQITSLSYPAGTSYVGGDVIPMTMTFRNNVATNGTYNVPYVPGVGFPVFFRIQVVLSSNPTYGDADDFGLVSFDIDAATLAGLSGNNGLTFLNADGADRTFSWNQYLPGNFPGSYYVLAKINMLPLPNFVIENDPAVQTVNGNNVWAGNSMNPNATLINLLPSNFPTTTLVSHANNVATTANNYSDNPSMTSDGRWVAFASDATNLVASDTNGARDIFLFDNQTNTTRLLSRSAQGTPGNGSSNNPALSSTDGRWVAFASDATNLVFGDTNGFSDIYAVDTVTGQISRVSVTSSGDQANNPSFKPAISQDGRYVAFESTATNLIPGVVRGFKITAGGAYVTPPLVTITGGGATANATAIANLTNGAVTSLTLTSGGTGYDGTAVTVAITGGGGAGATVTAYVTPAITVPFGSSHIYLRNRDVTGTGIFDTIGNTETVLVDVTPAGAPGNNSSIQAAISGDGSHVAFASLATDLFPGTAAGRQHIYERPVTHSVAAATLGNTVLGTIVLVSRANGAAGVLSVTEGNANSQTPSLSADGHWIAFASLATNLVAGDTNGVSDIFVFDATVAAGGPFNVVGVSTPDPSTALSVGTDPMAVGFKLGSINPTISADGRYIAFASLDSNLTAGTPGEYVTGGIGAMANNATLNAAGSVTGITLKAPNFGGDGYTKIAPVVVINAVGSGATATAAIALDAAIGSAVVGTTATATATVAGGFVTGIAVPVGGAGSGYVSAPTVTITGGGATTNATAIATIGGGAVLGITFTPGAGYTSAPVVTISPPGITSIVVTHGGSGYTSTPAVTIVGGGASTPATATATMAGGTVIAFNVVTSGAGYTSQPQVAVSQPPTGIVTGLNLAGGGSGYAAPPKVTITGGGATTIATATATMSGGSVSGFTVTAPGAGYTSEPVVTITSGDNAQAVATMSVTSGFVTNGGAGYTAPPAVTLTGGGGAGATATATIDVAGGVVKAINIATPGAGYTSAPSVTLSGGGGTGATAIVSMAVNAVTVPGLGATANATIGGGVVQSIAVTAGGSGYLLNPSVVITGGGAAATGASAVATVFNGIITGISVTNGGSGYTVVPTVTITNGGANYTSPPTVTIDSGGDANFALDIFVHDRNTAGAAGTLDVDVGTTLVSVNRWGYQTAALLGIPSTAASNIYPVLSADGRFVAFPSDAENNAGLAYGANNGAVLDSNGYRDIFIHDRRTNTLSPGNGNNPTITITNPGNGSSALVNSATTLTASAVAVVGVVANVQFYVNGAAQGGPITVFPYTTTWTPTAVGTYTLSAIVTDTFGNQGISSYITVSVYAVPNVSITSPTDGAVIKNLVTPTALPGAQIIAVSAAAATPGATISNVKISVSDGSTSGAILVPPYNFSWTPAAPGNYTITAVATDSNNITATSVVHVSVDQAPTVSISSPAAGTIVTVNTAQTITATAGPNGFIKNVEFLANGVSIGTATASPYTVTWTPTVTGPYSLSAIATNTLNTKTTSAAVAVTVNPVNLAAPTVSVPTVTGTLKTGTAQTITTNAFAVAPNTIANVQFLVNGAPLATVLSAPFTTSWTPLVPGTYSITAIATDSAANATTSGPASVTIIASTGTPPTVNITNPAPGATIQVNLPQTIAATANAPGGTVTQVQFLVNNTALSTSSVYPFTASWTPATPGTFVLTAIATDNSGNTGMSPPITVTVSTGTAPTVSITKPAAGNIGVNLPQTITATATSTTNVVALVEFFVNGLSIGTSNKFPFSLSWTPTVPGSYTLTATATDNVGNKVTSAPVVVTVVAGVSPTVSITSPVDGSAYGVGTPLKIAANAADPDGTIASVQFMANGVTQGAAVTKSPYTTDWTPASPGNYVLTAIATDNTGNQTTSAAVNVSIGVNAPPTVSITSPASGLSFGLGSAVILAAQAADTDGAVTSVQFFANGQAVGTAAAAPYLVSWAPQAAGNFSITAQATDDFGNVTTSAAVNVTITSNGAPLVAFTSPAAGSLFGVGTTITLNATAGNGNGPIAQVQFFVNGKSLSVDSAAPYSATWTPVAAGTYSLVAVATDSAGISTTSAALAITITGVNAPTVTLTNPAAAMKITAGTAVSLAANATSFSSTVAGVRFLANGFVIGTVGAAPFAAAWTPTAAGDYSIVAEATDAVGNVATTTPVVVTVIANLPPIVALIAPANGGVLRVGNGVTLRASASDPDGTVSQVQFVANGVTVGSSSVVTNLGYITVWTPAAQGVYRLTAVATDNAGSTITSSTVFVLVTGSDLGSVDTVYSGLYSWLSESGRFALINLHGASATFIGYSTTLPTRLYYYPGLAVDAAGGFSLTDAAGNSLIRGSVSDSGVGGTLGAGISSVPFSSPVILASSSPVASGYYAGSISGNYASSLAGIVGADGSITVYVTDSSFRDAGGSTLAKDGSFTITTAATHSVIKGKIDPATNLLTGTISGGDSGSLVGAIGSGVAFSDGVLKSLSSRGQVGTGENILIAGFVVSGTVSKQMLIRAIGPTLSGYGISSPLANPFLQLYRGGIAIASNDNWGGDPTLVSAQGAAKAFALPAGSLDSVLLATLTPGLYSAQVSGVGGTTGVALVEFYDLDANDPFTPQKFMSVSTRGLVGAGDKALIAGLNITGNMPKKVLVRAVGPTLAGFGVNNVLSDPVLTIKSSSTGATVRENDNWESGNDPTLVANATVQAGAFPLASGSKDAVILMTLPPGLYTAVVTGANGATGIALVEVYEVP
jgi:Tol biopolymer transport system component